MQNFKDEMVTSLARQITDEFLADRSKSLTGLAQKTASASHLTPHQIARVCERTNNLVNLALHKEAKDNKTDHRFTFDMADYSKIKEPERANYYRESDYILPVQQECVFPITDCSSIDALASVQDPDDIAKEILLGHEFKCSEATLTDALEIAKELVKEANDIAMAKKNELSDAMRELINIYTDYINQGETPATLDKIASTVFGKRLVKVAMDRTGSNFGLPQSRRIDFSMLENSIDKLGQELDQAELIAEKIASNFAKVAK